MGEAVQQSPVEYYQPILDLSTDYGENAKITLDCLGGVPLESVMHTLLDEKTGKRKLALFLGRYGDHNKGHNREFFQCMTQYGGMENSPVVQSIQMEAVAEQYRWILENLKNTIMETDTDYLVEDHYSSLPKAEPGEE